ncbi:MAG: hypothetical protein VB878_06665 [Pirellulaceae bacterium]
MDSFLQLTGWNSRFKTLASEKLVHRNTWRSTATLLVLFAGCSYGPVTDPAGRNSKALSGEERKTPGNSEPTRPEPTRYYRGYDPQTSAIAGIDPVPETAWGEAVDGLQAAFISPATVRRGEVLTGYFVVKNISNKTIRVSFPVHPYLRVYPDATPSISHGFVHEWDFVRKLELRPGYQAKLAVGPLQFLDDGDLGLNRSFKIQPGLQTWSVAIVNRGEFWVAGPDGPGGKSAKFILPAGEWKGRLTVPPYRVELLEEKVPFQVTAPPELKLAGDQSVEPVFDAPHGIDLSSAERIEIRGGLWFYLNRERDEHWLHDHDRFTRTVYWGPISGDRLDELGLLALLEQNSKDLLERTEQVSIAHRRVEALVSSSKPLAQLGLQLVSLLDEPKHENRISSDRLVRAIRDRRVQLQEMKLTKNMEAAIKKLTIDDPPLPDDSTFNVISDKTLPDNLPRDAWGPQNDGLRAAALMPNKIELGETVIVRLFIRNVSSNEIRLTVSDRPGYDYATGNDAKGAKLNMTHASIYPEHFTGVVRPEVNPGESAQSPPLTTLTKILLKPGAVFELKTKTALKLNRASDKIDLQFALGPVLGVDEPAVTTIYAQPTEAILVWNLHTANGAIYSPDLERRLWPARGGWSGLLRTAPAKVSLRAGRSKKFPEPQRKPSELFER